MTFELAFSLINLSVMPAWALLIIFPHGSITKKLVHSMLYPLVLGLVYAVGLGFAIFGGLGAEESGFTTIAAVRALFSTDMAWEARDARRRGFRHWLLIPCLLFTFMFGPLGLLLYVILRSVTRKGGWRLREA